MFPSPLEKKLASVPPFASAILHFLTGGTLGFLPGVVTYWLYKERSRFAAFNALQSMILGLQTTVLMGVAWGLGHVPFLGILAFIGWILAGISWVTAFGLYIVGGLAASRGDVFEFPIVGRIARRITGA